MVQVRKLALAIAAATTLSSGLAQALELGELTLKSAANQPLVAEIELRDLGGLTAPEIVPGLAPPEAFARAGLDRQAVLNQLSFTPVINPGGRSVIQVRSAAPLSEPLIKFLVQVIYPSGRLMRDYSVLVDASRFSPQAADAAVNTPAATPAVTAPATAGAKEYTTGTRDTLWEIAGRVRQQPASVQQTMLAIQALNPAAFQDNNINRLRTGQVLRLPDVNDSTALAQPQAVAEVGRQNAAWREGRRLGPRAQQLDATRRNGDGNAPAPEQGDRLKLVSAQDTNERAEGLAGDNKALADKLAVTQESLDSTRRENGELQSRLSDLQSQLEKAQRLLQLKSDQLARLEAGAAAPALPEHHTTQPDASVAGAAAPGLVPPASQPSIDAQLAPPPAQDAAADPVTAPTASEPTAATAPAEQEQASDSNPWVLGTAAGLALAAVLLAAWLLARRRKAQQESERHHRMAKELSEAQEFRTADFELPPTSFDNLGTPAPSVRLAPAMIAASAAAAAAAAAPVYDRPAQPAAPKDELPSVASLVVAPAADDPLVQAEEHMARHHYTRAADVLERAIEAEPERSELRLKLMEVYGHQGDRNGFVAQERELIANGAEPAQVERLKSRFPAMAALAAGLSAAAVAAELDAQYVKDLLKDEPDGPESIGNVFDTDFDLNLDGIETAPEEPVATAAEPAHAVPPGELDFEALLRQSTAQASAEPEPGLDAVEPAPSPVDDLDELAPPDPERGPAEVPGDSVASSDPDPLADFDLSLSDEQQHDQDRFAADVNDVNSQLDQLSQSLSQASATNTLHNGDGGGLDEFDFLADSDEVTTKLDLARAYIEMADADGARDILDEVLQEGTAAQQKEARQMLAALT